MLPKNILIAIKLLEEIENLGYNAYIVGGAVRDVLLNRKVSDVDITTNCPIGILENNFVTYDIGRSKDFGICVIIYEHIGFEVAQFRSDGIYLDGRHPDHIKTSVSLEEDIRRRDFTINALAMDKNGCIIDKIGGRKDLEAKVLRTVGNPFKRFREDYLRMLRAVRFAALGFKIDRKTRIAIRKCRSNISNIVPERIREEFYKASQYGAKEFASFIKLSDYLGLLSKIIPEISILKYYRHNLKHHPEGITVFDHIIRCLEIAKTNDFITLMAILLHDVGKSVTFSEDERGPHYYRHERIGTFMAETILTRLKFSNLQKEHILFAVKNHMKFNRILELRPSKIARMVESPYFNTLIEVAWADEFSRGSTFSHYGEFDNKLKKIDEIVATKAKINNNKKIEDLVDGNKIMALCNLKPSPIVGQIKRAVGNRILNETIIDYKNCLDKLIIEEYNKLQEV